MPINDFLAFYYNFHFLFAFTYRSIHAGGGQALKQRAAVTETTVEGVFERAQARKGELICIPREVQCSSRASVLPCESLSYMFSKFVSVLATTTITKQAVAVFLSLLLPTLPTLSITSPFDFPTNLVSHCTNCPVNCAHAHHRSLPRFGCLAWFSSIRASGDPGPGGRV